LIIDKKKAGCFKSLPHHLIIQGALLLLLIDLRAVYIDMEYLKLNYQTVGLDVEVYDERFEKADDPNIKGDIDFFVEAAKEYTKNGPVLELGVGTGRISWELANEGIYVTGLDISPTFIRMAQKKSARYSRTTQNRMCFVEGDMTNFELNEQFSLIIIPCRSFQCLDTVEKQQKCLKQVYKHLAPGGHLILDVFDPRFDPYEEHDLEEDIKRIPTVSHPETGNKVEIEFLDRKGDMLQQLIKEVWRYKEVDASGRVLRQHDAYLTMRWAFRQEMHDILVMSGFEVEAEYSDFQKSPPAYGKEQIWVVKKKA
jgi:SAM-dependent methyltransferase